MLVGVLDAVAQKRDQVGSQSQGDRGFAACQPVGKGPARAIGRNDVTKRPGLADFKDREDVGVVEPGGSAGFSQETAP